MTALPADDETPAAEEPAATEPGSLGSDLLRLFWRPGALFRDLPVVNRAAPALFLLMVLHALYGLALVGTGVPDYEIDWHTQKAVAHYRPPKEAEEGNDKTDSALDAIEKQGVFGKVLARLGLVAGGPVLAAAKVCVQAGLLFLLVAFSGQKPNYALLLGVVTFASYVEVPRLLLRLALVAELQIGRVETSAAAFLAGPSCGLPLYVLLRRLDPFDVWYYVLVALGAWHTGQLSRRGAAVAACLLALAGALAAGAGDFLELADLSGLSAGEP